MVWGAATRSHNYFRGSFHFGESRLLATAPWFGLQYQAAQYLYAQLTSPAQTAALQATLPQSSLSTCCVGAESCGSVNASAVLLPPPAAAVAAQPTSAADGKSILMIEPSCPDSCRQHWRTAAAGSGPALLAAATAAADTPAGLVENGEPRGYVFAVGAPAVMGLLIGF